MRLIITKNYEEMSLYGAKQIVELVSKKPDCILGLATGSTPEGLYAKVIEAYKRGEVDFSKVSSFNLDEYVGLSGEHPQSYRYFMNDKLFNHVNIDKSKTRVPNGNTDNAEEECLNYDRSITEAGGIDLQLLGIGTNGHIGFNEPSDSLNLGTHVTNLALDTIKANSRFFSSEAEVPKQAITMGLGSIMQAKSILLLASGVKKAPIISKLVAGSISTQIPASVLQLHKDVTVIVDTDAASELNLEEIPENVEVIKVK